MRPHVGHAEAYTTEQEAWRTWNDMHLSAEAQVNLPQSRPQANGPFRSTAISRTGARPAT
jgi:hypothetical protein